MNILQNWLILALLAGLGSNVFNFISRYLLRDNEDSTAYAWYYEIVRVISFSTIAVFFDWKIITTSYSVFLFILLGLTEWLAAISFMKMHQYTHLSISSILTRTRLLWVPILSLLIIGQHLSIPDYLGIVILFFGMTVIVAPHKILIDKGINYANFSAFMVAFNIVLTKLALPFGSNSVVNAVTVIPPVILIPLFMRDTKKRMAVMLKKNLLLKTFGAGLNVLYIYLFTQAIRLGDPSKTTAIYQGMMVVSVLLGIIFLKERGNIKRKLIGTGITLIGVIILSYT